MPLHEGEILVGKYRVERALGQGGMGVVVAAMHLQLRQRVALKLILPSARSQPGSAERLLREARAAAGLRSQHVVRVLDAGMLDSSTPFIVMELLEGSNLADELKAHGPMPVPGAVGFVLQACEALAEAHAKGIIHRDLKPANLFLTHTGTGAPLIKVLDFGISKVTEGESEAPLHITSGMLGSPLYMAPEQMRSSHDVDARADIWALGVVLFELLVGEPPFAAGALVDLFLLVASGARPSLEKLDAVAPPELGQIIARCLEQDPAKRFPSVLALATALGPFSLPVAPGQPTSPPGASSTQRKPLAAPWGHSTESTPVAWTEPPPAPDARRASARRAYLTGALLVLAGGAAVGGLSLRARGQPPSRPAAPLQLAPPSAATAPEPLADTGRAEPPAPPSASAPAAASNAPRATGASRPPAAARPRGSASAAPASSEPPPPPPPKASPSADDDIPRLRY